MNRCLHQSTKPNWWLHAMMTVSRPAWLNHGGPTTRSQSKLIRRLLAPWLTTDYQQRLWLVQRHFMRTQHAGWWPAELWMGLMRVTVTIHAVWWCRHSPNEQQASKQLAAGALQSAVKERTCSPALDQQTAVSHGGSAADGYQEM